MGYSPTTSTTHSIKDHSIMIQVLGSAPFPLPSVGNDSEAFTYERLVKEVMEIVTDCSGNAHFSIDPSKAGKLMFNMFHTNPGNAFLQALRGISTPQGEFLNPMIFSITIYDNQGKPFLVANKCRIEGPPSGGRGKKVSELQWTVLCAELLTNEIGISNDV